MKFKQHRMLQVGNNTVMVCNVRENHLTAQGPARGDILVCQQVDLLAPTKMEGTIYSGRFSLEEDVQATGTLTVDQR